MGLWHIHLLTTGACPNEDSYMFTRMHFNVCFESVSLTRNHSRPEWPTRLNDEAMESNCQYKLLIEVFIIIQVILYQSTKVICDDVFHLICAQCRSRTTIAFALSPMKLSIT